MTERVMAMSGAEFVSLWNDSTSVDEAVAKVRAVVGLPCPRWAVMARAVACRNEGAAVKRFPAPFESGGESSRESEV